MCCRRNGCGCNRCGCCDNRCGCCENRCGCCENRCDCDGSGAAGVSAGGRRMCGWEFVCRQAAPWALADVEDAASALNDFRLFEDNSSRGCGCG